MFEKLVGGIFGAGQQIPWNLVGYGAAVGVVAILIDRLFLEPRKTKFRLYAMPLAVGMYLPWTVTFPILIGGVVYKWVDSRSAARGDTAEQRQGAIHRGPPVLVGARRRGGDHGHPDRTARDTAGSTCRFFRAGSRAASWSTSCRSGRCSR